MNIARSGQLYKDNAQVLADEVLSNEVNDNNKDGLQMNLMMSRKTS